MQSSTLNYPLVSIITLNYLQEETTIELLSSLKSLTYPNLEIIVVDNGPDNERLRSYVKNMGIGTYLPTGANLGFAGGNNKGIRSSSGDYLLFLNNDTEVEPDLLDNLIPFVEKRPLLGMISPRICFYSEKDIIQFAGFTPLNPVTMRNKGIGFGEKDDEKYHDIRQTAFIHGAAMLVPRKIIDEVGAMKEDYFLYYEEYDWCARIKEAGYEIWYYGEKAVYHKESRSTGINSPLKVYYLNRNRLLFARRNFSRRNILQCWLYFSFIAMPKNVIQWLLKGRPDLSAAILKAWLWNLTHK